MCSQFIRSFVKSSPLRLKLSWTTKTKLKDTKMFGRAEENCSEMIILCGFIDTSNQLMM